MTDPLDRLKSAMDAATPPADADRKARSIADAEDIFARGQEMAAEARPKTDRTPLPGRLSQGVVKMFAPLTSRGGLVATTAIVAVGFVMILPQSREILAPPGGIQSEVDDADFREQTFGNPATTQEARRDEPGIVAEAPAMVEEFETGAEIAPSQDLGLADGTTDRIAPADANIATTSEATPQALAKQSARVRQAQEQVAGGLATIAPAPAPSDIVVQPESNTESLCQ